MQLAAAQAIRKRWPQAEIAIHTPHPRDDGPIYKDFEIVRCSRRRPLSALFSVVVACLARIKPKTWRPWRAELHSIRNATAVIDLSGDGLTETFGWKCPLSHSVPLLFAHLLGTPFCLMGQTIGPFGRMEPWFWWILAKAAFITARDDDTFRYLSGLRLPCRLEKTADVSFLLEPAAKEVALQHLQKIGMSNSRGPLIGVTPSNLYNVKTVAGLSARCRGDAWLHAVATACAVLAREVGGGVLIIPHVFGPGDKYDDRSAARHLSQRLVSTLPPSAVSEVTDSLGPQELKSLIGCCEVFIAARMHAVIAAVSQEVPTLALAYSPKITGLMGRLGMDGFVVEWSELNTDTLVAKTQLLWNSREATRARLRRAFTSDIFPCANRNFDCLADFVSGQSEPTKAGGSTYQL